MTKEFTKTQSKERPTKQQRLRNPDEKRNAGTIHSLELTKNPNQRTAKNQENLKNPDEEINPKTI